MSQLECPVCSLKIQALGAPVNYPRCLVRKGERIAHIAAAASVASPDRPSDDGAVEPPSSTPLPG
jgi:hypothetical protein